MPEVPCPFVFYLLFLFSSPVYAVVKQTPVLSSTPHNKPVRKLVLSVFPKDTDHCKSGGNNSSQSGKNVAKFRRICLTDSLLLKSNGTQIMIKSVTGYSLGSNNHENGWKQVPSKSTHNNEVQETRFTVNARAVPNDLFWKLFTVRRKLLHYMKQFLTLPERQLRWTQFESDLLHFQNIRKAYDRFCEKLKGMDDSNR